MYVPHVGERLYQYVSRTDGIWEKTRPGPLNGQIYHEMEVLEPYTAGELASYFDASKERIRKLLQQLSTSEKLRKKKPEPNQAIWIRDAPTHECTNCGYKCEVKFSILSYPRSSSAPGVENTYSEGVSHS